MANTAKRLPRFRVETKYFHAPAATKRAALNKGRTLAAQRREKVCVRDMTTAKKIACFTKTGQRIAVRKRGR